MKKIILIITAVIMGILPVSAYTVEENVTEMPVAKGVIHKNISTFTTEGWNNINILEIDLNEPGLSFKILKNNELSKRSTVGEFADNTENAVAAVNGDFFTSYTSGAAPEGMTVSDGKLLTTPSNDKSYVTFGTDKEGRLFADYFSFEIKVYSEKTGDMSGCLFYNKLAGAEYLKIYDRGFGEKSPGSMDDGYEVVVEDGVVTGVYSNKPGVEIPENGYVLHNSLRHSLFLSQNFQVGDKVRIEMTVTPDAENISEATGGGTLLLKDGKKTALTIKDGRNPVTAAGFNKKENILYLMTVDGRIKKSRGFTLSETADFLLNLGCTDGVSLDGGGSTSMAVKLPDDERSSYKNLSGGSRAVVNAVGILQESKPEGDLKYLKLSAEKTTIRENEALKLNVFAYDEYMNSLSTGEMKIRFSADKPGIFKEGSFYPGERGYVNIKATSGEITGELRIYVAEEKKPEDFVDRFFKAPEKEGYTVSFFGDNGNYNTLYTDIVTNIRNKLAASSDVAVFRQMPRGEIDSEVISLGRFSATENKYGAFIGINNSKGSVNSSDSSQWEKLDKFTEGIESENVFFMLASSYKSHDEDEKAVLIKRIREKLHGKNIFIISYGEDYSYEYDDGIRFITIKDIPHFNRENPFEALENTKYGRFTFAEDDISFEFVPFFEIAHEESDAEILRT